MKDGSSSYRVLARKYRPQTFDEVVGQERAARTLKNAIESNRVAHAYIFSGPRGVGKTSMARIFAKALNCKTGPTVAPCNECEICASVATGEDIDIIEIDGASNRGVEEARTIRDNVKYAPSRARFKIYIVDEAHMLTNEAFNALLKTLEEPPAHVKFFLATTDPGKLPETIRSRCQRFDFRYVPGDLIAKRLQEIAKLEGCQVEDGAISLVVKGASGSVRDSQSLFDQLIAFGGGNITTADAQDLLGILPVETVAALICTIGSRDASTALTLLHETLFRGAEPADVMTQIIEILRAVMLYHSCGGDHPLMKEYAAESELISRCAAAVSLPLSLTSLQVFSEAKRRMAFVPEGRLVLEMSLVRLARQESVRDLDEIVAELKLLRSKGASSGPGFRPSAPPSGPPRGQGSRPEPFKPQGDSPPKGTGKKEASPDLPSPKQRPGNKGRSGSPSATSETPMDSDPSGVSSQASKQVQEVSSERGGSSAVPAEFPGEEQALALWHEVVSRVTEINLTVGSFMGTGKLTRLADGEITLGFFQHQGLHVKMVDAPTGREIIEQVAEEVFGRKMRLVVTRVDAGEGDPEPRPFDDEGKAAQDPVASAILKNLGGRVIKYER